MTMILLHSVLTIIVMHFICTRVGRHFLFHLKCIFENMWYILQVLTLGIKLTFQESAASQNLAKFKKAQLEAEDAEERAEAAEQALQKARARARAGAGAGGAGLRTVRYQPPAHC